MPTKSESTPDHAARYTCDISKVQAGDVLLSRIPMDLDNEATWDSHLIRALTRSSYSFAALCVTEGLFIEAVGTGVARLPLLNAGVRDSRNIRVLRPRKDYRWAAIRAAACGLGYLERGFYQPGTPRPQCTAFQDVRRAAATTSDIVVNAYLEAGLEFNSTGTGNSFEVGKLPSPIFAGDLVDSIFFEDITSHVLQPLSDRRRAAFNLDDDTLRQRIHHWEVETQLKVLCKYEVRRILELKSEKPSSLAELEMLIATNQWRSLDSALHHSLRWYRYDKLYRLKQNQLLNNISLRASNSHLSLCDDDAMLEKNIFGGKKSAVLGVKGIFGERNVLDGRKVLEGRHVLREKRDESEICHLIKMEANYCRQQRDRYKDLIASYKCSSFYYMHDLFNEQEEMLSRMLDRFNDEKEDSLLMDNFIADYVNKGGKKYEERLTHKKYYEIN